MVLSEGTVQWLLYLVIPVLPFAISGPNMNEGGNLQLPPGWRYLRPYQHLTNAALQFEPRLGIAVRQTAKEYLQFMRRLIPPALTGTSGPKS